MADPIAVFVQEGFTIDYTPVADVAAGAVIDLGAFVGMALRDIPANTLGALVTYQGPVFDFLKYANEVIAFGDSVYWDAGTGTVSKTIAYSEARIGHCILDAAAGDARVRVKVAPPIV